MAAARKEDSTNVFKCEVKPSEDKSVEPLVDTTKKAETEMVKPRVNDSYSAPSPVTITEEEPEGEGIQEEPTVGLTVNGSPALPAENKKEKLSPKVERLTRVQSDPSCPDIGRKETGFDWTLGVTPGSECLTDMRRKSEGLQFDSVLRPQTSYRKHSSGDLHSRLKTRKLLGVGETDDGDVHRSKLSQILGHSDQLYIRLPNGLRLWQIVMALLFSVMAIWAFLFPVHYYSTMFEADGQHMSLPIRLYATALVSIAVVYWSTVQAADRDIIRLVLLSSVIFFTLQTIVTGIAMVPDMPSKRKIALLAGRVLCSAVGYYFYVITGNRGGNLHRTTSSKDLSEKEQ